MSHEVWKIESDWLSCLQITGLQTFLLRVNQVKLLELSLDTGVLSKEENRKRWLIALVYIYGSTCWWSLLQKIILVMLVHCLQPTSDECNIFKLLRVEILHCREKKKKFLSLEEIPKLYHLLDQEETQSLHRLWCPIISRLCMKSESLRSHIFYHL